MVRPSLSWLFTTFLKQPIIWYQSNSHNNSRDKGTEQTCVSWEPRWGWSLQRSQVDTWMAQWRTIQEEVEGPGWPPGCSSEGHNWLRRPGLWELTFHFGPGHAVKWIYQYSMLSRSIDVWQQLISNDDIMCNYLPKRTDAEKKYQKIVKYQSCINPQDLSDTPR